MKQGRKHVEFRIGMMQLGQLEQERSRRLLDDLRIEVEALRALDHRLSNLV